MDPILGTIPQTPPPWVRDAFLELRRVRERASMKPCNDHPQKSLAVMLRPDRFAEFKRYTDEMHDGVPSTNRAPLQIGGVPVREGPADMPEPGWTIEL